MSRKLLDEKDKKKNTCIKFYDWQKKVLYKFGQKKELKKEIRKNEIKGSEQRGSDYLIAWAKENEKLIKANPLKEAS